MCFIFRNKCWFLLFSNDSSLRFVHLCLSWCQTFFCCRFILKGKSRSIRNYFVVFGSWTEVRTYLLAWMSGLGINHIPNTVYVYYLCFHLFGFYQSCWFLLLPCIRGGPTYLISRVLPYVIMLIICEHRTCTLPMFKIVSATALSKCKGRLVLNYASLLVTHSFSSVDLGRCDHM